MAGLPLRARLLLHGIEANLRQTESVVHLADSKLTVGDLPEALVKDLPEPLRWEARCVRGLRDIGVELHKPGDSADVKVLTGALKDVHAANPKLAVKVRERAVALAEGKGQPRLAKQLRDIELGLAPGAEEPFEMAAYLPPPSAPGTSQAGQQESLLKGLEDFGPEVSAEARTIEQKLNRDLERWADIRYTMGHSFSQLYCLTSNQPEKPDDPQLAAQRRGQRKQCLLKVEGTLHRKLRPSERLLVADMFARGYTEEQIVADLRELDREEDQP
jgi:hypothetical protein